LQYCNIGPNIILSNIPYLYLLILISSNLNQFSFCLKPVRFPQNPFYLKANFQS